MQNLMTSFTEKAEFLKRNVADFPGGLTESGVGGPDAAAVLEGLGQFRELLLALYAEPAVFRAETDLDSYHNLTYTASFFPYAIMAAGKLRREGVNSYFSVDKPEFRKQYRKNSAFPFEALENFGVYFVYSRQFREAASYAKCDSFELRFECGNHIALALSHLVGRMKPVNARTDYVLSAKDLLALADYGPILLGKPTGRGAVGPGDARLLRTAGARRGLWEKTTAALEACGLEPQCSLFSYLPAWIVRWMRRGECAAIFTLAADRFAVELGESFDGLSRLARAKDGLPGAARALLDGLGCIGCGRCVEAGQALESINGVKACPREAYARRFMFEIAGEEGLDAALALIRER